MKTDSRIQAASYVSDSPPQCLSVFRSPRLSSSDEPRKNWKGSSLDERILPYDGKMKKPGNWNHGGII
nr:hypothetical protein Iba_chr06aCG12090 [Ipomoea batatas]GMD40281.1 hypothetical protein Iba_chr10aCG7870 [Ipomoea batatas]GMD45162.1 hypothetical protein Iba_chr10dCG7370 [Ipomoea batatas]GMD46655.1 hypothetical protein Iba_chr10eCG5390 [Ipomoea batatas]GME16145.1 hypothetical protein Iba_scaffold17137CG0010 [Ipomoea batatas]